MPSYTTYKRQMAVLDADDIESWITVKGNHIPIKKGQSKEEAVKSFLESKGGNSSAKGSSQKNELSIAYHKEKGHIKEGTPPKGWTKVEGGTTAPNGYSWYSNNKSMFGGERESYLYKDTEPKTESSGWTEHKGGSTKTFNTRKELVKELWDNGYEVDNIGELKDVEFAWKDGVIYSFRLDKQSDGTIEAVKSKRAEATKKEFVEFLEKQHDYGDSDDDYYDDDNDNDDDDDNDGYEGITNSSEAMMWLNNQIKKHGNTYFWNEKQKSKLNKLVEKYGNTYFWNK